MEKTKCYVCKEEYWPHELRQVMRSGVDGKVDVCSGCAANPVQTYGEVEDAPEGNDV